MNLIYKRRRAVSLRAESRRCASFRSCNAKKIHLLVVAVFLLFAVRVAATAIDIPGTGRNISLNASDTYWKVAGAWNMDPDIQFSGIPKRIGTTASCFANGDYEVEFFTNRPSEISGVADVYFYREFKIIEAGSYSISCQVTDGESADIAQFIGLGQPNTVGGFQAVQVQQLANGTCESVNITASLAVGRYAFRVKSTLATVPISILVSSASSGNFGNCIPVLQMTSLDSKTIASGQPVNITLTSTHSSQYVWSTAGNTNTNIGAGSYTTNAITQTIINNTSQTQIVVYTVTPTSVAGECQGFPQTVTVYVTAPCVNGCDTIQCSDCIGSFAPEPGKKYVISAWVQEANSSLEMTYTGPAIGLNFTGGSSLGPFKAKGEIIDGWQRIDTTFTVPSNASAVFVRLINTGNNEVYFDDLRIHPLKASLKSFVYDPISMRLMAELDENNYATFYEYDEEGKLVRVKKETERGVKTIKETISSTRKNTK